MHEGAEVFVAWRPEHQMKVVGHEAVADAAHAGAGTGLPQEADEVMIVVGVVEDAAAFVASVEDVIAAASDSSSSGTRHAAIVAEGAAPGKRNMSET
jgi:hypothetical protein